MLAYVVRKVLFSLTMLLFASAVIFWVVSLSGDPLVELRQNPNIPREELGRIADRYGLDEPLPVQYAIWLGGLLKGDLGESFKQRLPVNDIIGNRVAPTILLMGTSLVFTVMVAVPFGVYSAVRKYSFLDNAGTLLSFLGFSMPVFWLGLILQLVLGVYLTAWAGARIFYVSGMTSVGGGGFVNLLQHLALPVLAHSVVQIAAFSRFQRGAMLDVLSSDYLRTARAKGLGPRQVYLKHGLRNALIPIVTLLAIQIGLIFNGAVIVESVFAWPGLGFLLVDSLYKGDFNVARGLLMISAVLVVFFNLMADILYSVLDPRVTYD